MNRLKQFKAILIVENNVKLLIFCRSKEKLTTGKGKTWSRGTNLLLAFRLGHPHCRHRCRHLECHRHRHLILLLLLLLQVIPAKVNYNYFILYKASRLNLKII